MKALSVHLVLLFLSTLILGVSATTQKYDLKIEKKDISPDGFQRSALVINGQTPGPALRLVQGDAVEITVTNYSEFPLTIHWHGVHQLDTPWSDGVPGVTQRLIEHGETFIYKFNVNQHGIYWYHAHSRLLYQDGVRGALYVAPTDPGPYHLIAGEGQKTQIQNVIKAGPEILQLHDWNHYPSEHLVEEWEKAHVEPLCQDAILINGMGQVKCHPQSFYTPWLTPLAPQVGGKGCILPNNTNFFFWPDTHPELTDDRLWNECIDTNTPLHIISVKQSDGWAYLALVNLGGLDQLKFSIDNHRMYIFAADGNFHYPQEVDVVSIPIGERFEVLVRLDRPPADYTIRVASDVAVQFLSGYAVLSYERYDQPTQFTSPPAAVNPVIDYGGIVASNKTLLKSLSLKPWPPSPPPPTSDYTFKFILGGVNATAWALNIGPYSKFHELDTPVLFAPMEAMSTLSPNLRPAYPAHSVVDLILQSNPRNPPHPVHKHGVPAYIIGQGPGAFNWSSVAEAIAASPTSFNLVDPPLRDGFITAGTSTDFSWTVIRYEAPVNTITFMHCHINEHLFGGMAVVLLEGADNLPPIPEDYLRFQQLGTF